MLVRLLNKSLLSLILVMLFILGGMCKCILFYSDCYLGFNQEEICLDEDSCNDTQCTTTDTHQEDNNCCPIQCLFKDTDDLFGETISFSLGKNLTSLITTNYLQNLISKPIFSVKPIWGHARAPSTSFNLQSQNSILRI